MMMRVLCVMTLALAWPNPSLEAQGPIAGTELRRVESAAAKVTIVRDRWGVPHVYAPTDAGVTLGIGYAQAEDNWWLLEQEYIRITGRAAELEGDSVVAGDAATRLGRVEQRARERLAAATPAFRAMMAAYADGVNLWIARHPQAPRLITRFEPWFPLAFDGGAGVGGGARLTRSAFGLAARGSDAPPPAAPNAAPDPGEGEMLDAWARTEAPEGSNAWAVAPSRTTTGHAMLFMNPHWNFLTAGLRWEVHVESGSGWRFSGFCILGNPIPRTGQNGRLGWTHTNLAGDFDDLYAVTFDHPTDSLMYRFDGGWRKADTWSDTVMVKRGDRLEPVALQMRRTVHGPIVAWTSPTQAVAARTLVEVLTASPLEQRFAMGRSANLAEWRRAMEMRTFAGSYSTYADVDGNILLAFGNAAPKRRAGVPWRGNPVLDGADASTLWTEMHPLEEMPLLLNPAPGFVLNTNSTPWRATGEGANLDSTKYAPYVAMDRENARSVNSHRLLAGTHRYSFVDWARATMDRRVSWADSVLPGLLTELERFAAAYPGRTIGLRELADTLRAWDRVSDTTSIATTLFVQWDRDMRLTRPQPWDSAWRRVAALERARDSLAAAWGTWRVPFGRVNRLQRVHPSGEQPFDSTRRSWAVPNIEGTFGIIMNMTSTPNPTPERGGRPSTTARRRHGVAGNSYVGITHFAPRVEHRSVLTLGQSADSTSPHHTDQAALFAGGTYKPAPFYADEVQAVARRAYAPGGRDMARPRVPSWAKRAPAASPPRRVAER